MIIIKNDYASFPVILKKSKCNFLYMTYFVLNAFIVWIITPIDFSLYIFPICIKSNIDFGVVFNIKFLNSLFKKIKTSIKCAKRRIILNSKFDIDETRTNLRPHYVYLVSKTTIQYTLLVTLHNMKENNENTSIRPRGYRFKCSCMTDLLMHYISCLTFKANQRPRVYNIECKSNAAEYAKQVY